MSTSSSSSSSSSMMSFYQRTLPADTCVAFTSKEGKKIFQSALHNKGLKSFYNLMEQHHTQTEPAFCGVSTLVLVLNALAVDPGQHWKGPWRWYEERMLNCCLELEEIKKNGITLKDFTCLAMCQGLSVDLHYCGDRAITTLQDFRHAIEASCVESDDEDEEAQFKQHDPSTSNLQVLVVSYHRKVLKQTGSGHFSPIAAYDKQSDSVLILDTARFKYGAHWVKVPLLYQAMTLIDPDTNLPRGFVLLSFIPSPTSPPPTLPFSFLSPASDTQPNTTALTTALAADAGLLATTQQPTSILFRSTMKGMEERRRFKQYLESLPHKSFEKVRTYWISPPPPVGKHDDTATTTTLTRIWKIVEPLRAREDHEKIRMDKIRTLLQVIQSMVGTTTTTNNISPTADQKNNGTARTRQESCSCQHSITADNMRHHPRCVSVEEAVMVVYLASLSEKERTNLVMKVPCDVDITVRQDLLNEANLIASAIAMSDEFQSF